MTEQNNLGWKEPSNPIRSAPPVQSRASFKVGTSLNFDLVAQGLIQPPFGGVQGQRFHSLARQPLPTLTALIVDKNGPAIEFLVARHQPSGVQVVVSGIAYL